MYMLWHYLSLSDANVSLSSCRLSSLCRLYWLHYSLFFKHRCSVFLSVHANRLCRSPLYFFLQQWQNDSVYPFCLFDFRLLLETSKDLAFALKRRRKRGFCKESWVVSWFSCSEEEEGRDNEGEDERLGFGVGGFYAYRCCFSNEQWRFLTLYNRLLFCLFPVIFLKKFRFLGCD